MTKLIQHLFLPSLTIAVVFSCANAATSLWAQEDNARPQTDDLKARLADLEEKLEEQRLKLHIPGLAIAIVKDDKVILSKGFGQSDVAGNKPVTPETLFAIGSTTKAFTTTLIGMG